MPSDAPATPTARSIAEDLQEYLQANPGVCAEGNVHGWRWVRYWNDEWRATRCGGQHRLSDYVHGAVLTDDDVLEWLAEKPVTLKPAGEARRWSPKDETVWEDATEQDVFEDVERCFWCGTSAASTDLTLYETAEQGVCWFCPDCQESWDRAGEIASGPLEVTA